MKLTMHHLKVDDLRNEVAFEIAGGPNPERPALAAKLFAEGAYEPVAVMDASATSWGLETIYAATQNTDAVLSWSRSPPIGVKPIEPVAHFVNGHTYGRRSSMVGDIIESDNPPARWVVDWQGFAAVPKP